MPCTEKYRTDFNFTTFVFAARQIQMQSVESLPLPQNGPPVTLRVPHGIKVDHGGGPGLYWRLAILTTLLSREDSKQ
jgi:hypothetical protein